MAGSPKLKIYTAENEYIASCKYAEDAIQLAQLNGNGSTVRYNHSRRNIVYKVTDQNCDFIDAEKLWECVDSLFIPRAGQK